MHWPFSVERKWFPSKTTTLALCFQKKKQPMKLHGRAPFLCNGLALRALGPLAIFKMDLSPAAEWANPMLGKCPPPFFRTPFFPTILHAGTIAPNSPTPFPLSSRNLVQSLPAAVLAKGACLFFFTDSFLPWTPPITVSKAEICLFSGKGILLFMLHLSLFSSGASCSKQFFFCGNAQLLHLWICFPSCFAWEVAKFVSSR